MKVEGSNPGKGNDQKVSLSILNQINTVERLLDKIAEKFSY
jgi:hypothetical protein